MADIAEHGGTPIDDAAACQLLGQAGLASVRTVPTPGWRTSHHHRPEPSLRFKDAAVWSFMRPGPLKESLARARARGLAGS
jgi:hypothetical protein